MASTPIVRFFSPQRLPYLPPLLSRPLLHLHLTRRSSPHHLRLPPRRHASSSSSSSSSSKPRVLEKPSKFAPPSHPQRLNRSPPRQYPGPPLSATELAAQKTKRYPHTMPPEGSFMYKFLTNRSIHVWITLTTLFSLALYTLLVDFQRKSPYAHLLPSSSTFTSHPVDYMARYVEVYKLHTAHLSAETAERRRKAVEDAQKRSRYRRAHGIESTTGVMGLGVEGEGEGEGEGRNGEGEVGDGEGEVVEEKRMRRPVKKWFGVW